MEPVDRFTAATRYWHELADGRAQCDLCPHACKLRDGQRGLCFVRSRAGAQVVLTSYGRSSGFWVDPVEKKPLNHFLPGNAVLSFGTAGCNLACRFCQNWDISKSREFDTLSQEASPQAIASAAKTLGAASIAFTYNDPVPFMEFAIDCADAAHELGLRAIAVTAGYICAEPRAEMYAHMDAANIDLKAFSEGFYKHICGAQLGAVLDTLEYLRTETTVWLEITNLLVPDANDSDAEIDAMTSWVVGHLGADVPLHFTAFHPDFKMTDRPRTPAGALRPAESPWPTGCVTPTPGTSTTPRGAAPTARVAVPAWWSVTGSRSVSTASRATATARTAAPAAPASTTGQQGPGAPAAVPCASPRP